MKKKIKYIVDLSKVKNSTSLTFDEIRILCSKCIDNSNDNMEELKKISDKLKKEGKEIRTKITLLASDKNDYITVKAEEISYKDEVDDDE